jgi:hypothetical protein
MVELEIVLILRLVLSVGAIALITAGLSLFSGAATERGLFDRRCLVGTSVAWVMIETVVFFQRLLPPVPWVLLCGLEFFLHTGMLSRLLGRSMKSTLPISFVHAGMIAFVLMTIILMLEGMAVGNV